jgi:methylenetetrahydrofolate dehydrogenase (NADP+)/methenyltetrahydrofolate cyclohydrolase
MTKILDGYDVAQKIKSEIAPQIEAMGQPPKLAVVVCSEDPASQIYVQNKLAACAEVGIQSLLIKPFENPDPKNYVSLSRHGMKILLAQIESLNNDDSIDGIIIQLPLPEIIDQQKIFDQIDPLKDVDCFSPVNMGLLLQGRPRLVSCTPAGIQELLLRNNINFDGKKVTIINRSNIVGKPLQALLSQNNSRANATCVLCHDHTSPEMLKKECLSSDIIVVAVGIPNFLTPDMVPQGAVVVDVGINRLAGSNKIIGDVHPDVYPLTSAYTPVPRGIGPMTVAMLLRNTFMIRSHKNFFNKESQYV